MAEDRTAARCLDPEVCNFPNGRCVEPSRCDYPRSAANGPDRLDSWKRPNPPVRRDGLCYICKSVRSPQAVKDKDPFCSNVCCRDYFGVPQALTESGKSPQDTQRMVRSDNALTKSYKRRK